MNKEHSKKSFFSSPRFLSLIWGIILMTLSVIAATGKTPVGGFLTYILAFLFGLFYPLLLVLLFLFGLRLAISGKGFSFSGKGAIGTGIFLIFVVALCLGSLPILFSNKDLRITDLTYVYSSRFSAFSNHLFEVDSFADLGSLGGGFLGLFFVLLLGSMWGGIGDAIFFALLLLFSLILLLYQPILSFVAKSKAKAKEIISYSSPNEKKKKSRRERREDEKARRISEALGTANPYSQGGFQSANSMADRSQNDFASIRQAEDRVGITREQKRPAVQESYVSKAEAPVKPEESYLPRPSYMPKTDTGCFSRAARSADASTTEMPNAYTEEGPYAESDKAALRSFIPSRPRPIETAPVIDTIPVPSSQQEAPIPEREEQPMEEAETNKDSSFQSSFSPAHRYEEETHDFVLPDTSPESQSAASSDPAPKEERKSPKAIQAEIDAAYFRKKAEEKLQQARAKKALQEQKKASLMQFVSIRPRKYDYALPREDLLTEIHDDKYKVNQEAGFEKAKIISKVFGEFNFPAKVVSITVGASVTRLNVKTDPGVRVDKLSSLGEEIQIALRGDKSVRIETVVEGKDTSGIELKNEAPMAVSFYGAYKEIEKDTKEKLLLPIGKDISGNMITFPLDDMPHLLIAGTTGSGKSVLVHCMIMTLIMRNYPSELKLMLIDPKQVEFAKYNMEPHLYCPVISESQSAINGLEKLCGEMDRRYTLFRQNGVVKMSEYNARRAGNESRMEALPNVVCVIDEFADLMQTGGDAVASSVQRLCQKARACGIYLIIATQRPSKDVIPMVIKANIACRIALSCSSQVDSRVILDENGAETLVGKGDLLFKCPGRKSLIRCQSPFISNEDMDRVLGYIKQNAGTPSYDPDFLDLAPKDDKEEDNSPLSPEEVYAEIADYVETTGTCSKQSIMENFYLSSSKATMNLLQLEQDGIITRLPDSTYSVIRRK